MNNYLGSWGNWIGQIADDVSHQIDDSLQNVEQIVRTTLTPSGGFGIGAASGYSGPCFPAEHNQSQNQEQNTRKRRESSHYMGNGGLSGSTTPTSGPAPPFGASEDQEAGPTKMRGAKTCDHCSSKFSLFNRKKICQECRDSFCNDCIVQSRSTRRLCVCCNILLKRPLVRADLMRLRVKDLQRYLLRKNVNTKSCLEKKDLVELIIRDSLGGSSFSSSAPASPGGGVTAPDERSRATRPPPGPIERQSSFPKAYVESNHRREWLEKMDRAGDERTEPESASMEDNVVAMESESEDTSEGPDQVEETPVEEITRQLSASPVPDSASDAPEASGVQPEIVVPIPADVNSISGGSDGQRSDEGAVGGRDTLRPAADANISSDLGSSSATSSPRRFARQGLVRLEDIDSVEELHELSAKQIKDLLALNRVNFHGVIEKEELIKIVERLWRQEKKAQEDKDTMEDQDLCKICWDAAVDCVMLECGHMATCTKCGKQLAECPICRQYVVRVVRTFKA